MSGENENWLDWRQFGKVEWAFVAGLLVMIVTMGLYAVDYISKADVAPLPELTATARSLPVADGFLLSASNDKIVIELGNGKKRTFAVRPQDRPNVGIPYLAAHADRRDLGFLIYYDTQGGIDYAMGALETDPPPAGVG